MSADADRLKQLLPQAPGAPRDCPTSGAAASLPAPCPFPCPGHRGIAGIFVGGASSRMGGRPKGLLQAPDGSGSLVERLAALAREAGLQPVLVGRSPAVETATGLPVCVDEPARIGPLGGVRGLLRATGRGVVVTLACDLPGVDRPLLARLLAEAPDAPILAPRDEAGRWQPFFTRWRVEPALPLVEAAHAGGARSLQGLLARHATPLALGAGAWHLLRDWDTPADVEAG